jgi:acyl-CoA synthetase (AMP-forming)/AMP-acid ligase II
MAMLLELLAAASGERAVIRSLSRGDESATTAELWRRSARVAGQLCERYEAGESVAALLRPTLECMAFLVGAWRAGLRVASLPHPSIGGRAPAYVEDLRSMQRQAEAPHLFVDGRTIRALDRYGLEVRSFQSCLTGSPRDDRSEGAAFVQFTSGSTSRPKGIVLGLDAIASNVISLLEVVQPAPGDVACSWLPLSHDMGLVFMLASWAAAAPTFAAGGTLCLIEPEQFLRNPATWLGTCAKIGAAYTVSPNFGLQLAARALPTLQGAGLGSLRVCLVGAEPIRTETLRAFEAATAPLGFDSLALCPAYGLAEATVGVTVVRPSESWKADSVSAEDVAEGSRRPQSGSGAVEYVCLGSPLPQMAVRVRPAPGREVGEIEVAGPSLLQKYLGRDVDLADGRWFATGDLGYLLDGELYCVGRQDDILFVRGRNLSGIALEAAAESHPAVRTGACIAVQDDAGRYAIVAEASDPRLDSRQLREASRWVRAHLASEFGAAPSTIVFIGRGRLPRTPSGKLRRRLTEQLFQKRALAIRAEERFGPRE